MEKEDVFKKYVIDEMSKFKFHEEIINFVNTLNSSKVQLICKWLSNWRNNKNFDFISTGPTDWSINIIDISNIRVSEINKKINPLLEKNNFSLKSISQDRELCNHDEFKSQGDIEDKDLSPIKGMKNIILSMEFTEQLD